MLSNIFKKSSFSGDCTVPYCVICRLNKDIIQVASSNNPEKLISYSVSEWQAFIDGVKSGEFDIK